MIRIKSGKKAGIIIAILIVIIVAVALVSYKLNEEPTTAKPQLTLADYPGIFKKDVIIVMGENANSIEIEAAQRIADNLGNLTGNIPLIKTDAEITEDELAGHNLILVGGADSNEVLQKVYAMTDATRVTEEYPGAGKGVLEILRNPWHSEKAMLLVGGSDEWGVKAGSIELKRMQELNQSSFVAEFVEPDSKRHKIGSYLSFLIDTKGLDDYYSVDIEFSHELSNKELTVIEETYNLSFSRLPNGSIAHTHRFYGGLVDGYAINQLIERSDIIRIVSTEKPIALP